MNTGWGKPKYGNSSTTNHWSIKKGRNFYRILPPMKSMADEERWFNYVGIHFGFVGIDPRDPSKTRMRTFRCIKKENRRQGTVEQTCPMCDKIDEQRQVFEDTKGRLKAGGMSNDQITAQVAPLEAWLKSYNLDWKCYVNAMNKDGQFGDLKLNHKFHKKAINAKIDELLAMNIDPLDLEQGVWWDINRTTLDGNDSVDVEQEAVSVAGRTFFAPKKAPLDEAMANRAMADCQDLRDIGFELSFEQITALVECSGEPEDVDKVFGMSQKVDPKPAPARQPATPANDNAQAAATPAPGTGLNDPAIQARLASIKAKKDAEAALAAPKTTESTAMPMVSTDDMSDEAFLAFATNQGQT